MGFGFVGTVAVGASGSSSLEPKGRAADLTGASWVTVDAQNITIEESRGTQGKGEVENDFDVKLLVVALIVLESRIAAESRPCGWQRPCTSASSAI